MKNLEETLKVATASVFHLTTKAHVYHFNVTGPRFYELHKLLELIYTDLQNEFDGIGEQCRALDVYAPNGLSRLLELSILTDQSEILSAQAMIHDLLIDLEKVTGVLHEVNTLAPEHLGLQNFIQNLIDKLEKYSWFLRATLKGK
jgi:starvation-inducible DNA-binding protein